MNSFANAARCPAVCAAEDEEPRRERIESALDGLGMPISQIDDSFVAVGDTLANCATLLGKVTATFEELSTDLDGDGMRTATDKLAAVIRQAEDIAHSFETEQVDLDILMKQVKAVRTPLDALRKNIQLISTIAINARVVAATLPGTRDEFSVFTSDIGALSRDATQTVDSFFRTYLKLRSDLTKAVDQRERFQSTQQAALEHAAKQLSHNLDQAMHCRARAAQTSSETSRITRDVTLRVGAAVMALQVGDSTRQRVEHVASALILARTLLTGRMPEGLAPDAVMPDNAVEAVLYAQGEMLAAALVDYRDGVAEAETALTSLGDDADAILAISRDLYGRQDNRANFALHGLGDDLQAIAAMLEICDSDRQKIDSAALAVGSTVDELLDQVAEVKKIENTMRLVTLNAAVKCAQLGSRGLALDVIAKQLRELAAETLEAAETSLGFFDAAAHSARNVVARADGDASDRIESLIGDAVAAVGLFEQLDGRLSSAMAFLEDQAHAIDQAFAEAAQRFAGHKVISAALDNANAEIVALAGRSGPEHVAALAADQAGSVLVTHLRGFCTMQSERQIYDALLCQTSNSAQVSDDDPDEDDLSVDLF